MDNLLQNKLWEKIEELALRELSNQTYNFFVKNAKIGLVTASQVVIIVEQPMQVDFWKNEKMQMIIMAACFDILENGSNIMPIVLTEADAVKQGLTNSSQKNSKLEHEIEIDLPPVKSNLNPKFTFENYVIGKGNMMAHAAAAAVAETPGIIYNPLFIWGGSGLGKTHLMHAVGNEILKHNPKARIKYISSENFVNEYVNSMAKKTQRQFKRDFRNLDVLLLDDIQFFSNKDGTQEEFFNTFEALHNNEKQIVLTSDRMAKDIENMEMRLVTRFESGLSTDITPPDLDTRVAILREKAEAQRINFPNEVYEYIAGVVDTNVRELEASLREVDLYAKTYHNGEVTTAIAAEALKMKRKEVIAVGGITIDKIQTVVAKYYKIPKNELVGKKRNKEYAVPRQIAMYLTRELTDASLPQIGQEFGGKDHTTVMYAHRKLKKDVKFDLKLQSEINEIQDKLIN
ncbi:MULTISPECIES: chromosomal replication initiator protein DnaA [unclassified Enterococcus]|uniref:chromosomal replication initiator protein DnaA n=1 Tax=unclassified Enterococcus TaxID=2608891 RepID=UPI0015567C2B|nr:MULTISPECIES: chromosomal replication initiator protein DnaA [unclassified Enterococcus]MBS7577766.1 chromosomal replication initiator protein DnaA [Enterococcus sp. MMGLQ5-2]MBS7585026.1 chromosomal replication initiator protein DnaA [Enterococcus sp. MMGLQ5-1]NPD12882.1 chromosomal replication initiator protein DnaA [Enterococcus sp. MMGLQ5-1]NPD37596.1 chromosomal replication initiator protein DnaA [Enterococcus sp. MMGLQ5-2]